MDCNVTLALWPWVHLDILYGSASLFLWSAPSGDNKIPYLSKKDRLYTDSNRKSTRVGIFTCLEWSYSYVFHSVLNGLFLVSLVYMYINCHCKCAMEIASTGINTTVTSQHYLNCISSTSLLICHMIKKGEKGIDGVLMAFEKPTKTGKEKDGTLQCEFVAWWILVIL